MLYHSWCPVLKEDCGNIDPAKQAALKISGSKIETELNALFCVISQEVEDNIKEEQIFCILTNISRNNKHKGANCKQLFCLLRYTIPIYILFTLWYSR